MKRIKKSLPRPLVITAIAVLAVFLVVGVATGDAAAHGKEIEIEISSVTPNPEEPLVRIYRAIVVFKGDREPVEGAKVQLTMNRRDGGPAVESVDLGPLNDAGVYVGQVTFPIPGSWNMSLSVAEQGEGEAAFVEEVLPPGPSADASLARERVLDVFFRFNWRDVAAILVRITHTFASVVWFGMTGIIIVAYSLVPTRSRADIFRVLSSVFPAAAASSLAALTISGVYSAIYSAPIKPPGAFDLKVMTEIPFGTQYLGAIVFKAFAMVAFAVIAWSMARELKNMTLTVPMGGSTAVISEGAPFSRILASLRVSRLLRLALTNTVLAIFLAIDVVIVLYLHTLSHLAVFLPS